MNTRFLTACGVVFVLVIYIFGNAFLMDRFSAVRWDVTEEGAFTLSSGSKELMQGLESPVRLRLFRSRSVARSIPFFTIYSDRVESLLKEMAAESGGMVALEIVDPEPDSAAEDAAIGYGLTGMQTAQGERLYLGLVAINASGETATIPFFDLERDDFLEYDVAKTILKISAEAKPRIAIASSLPLDTSPSWWVLEELKESAKVTFLRDVRELGASAYDLLILIHPKKLTDAQLYAIDQFALAGGPVLALVDPFCSVDTTGELEDRVGGEDRSSNLPRLFKAWGVSFNSNAVVGDLALATPVVDDLTRRTVPFVFWLRFGEAFINQADSITSSITEILIPWGGAFHIEDSLKGHPILITSDEAREFPPESYSYQGGDPVTVLGAYTTGIQSYTTALRLMGEVSSVFSETPPRGASSAGEHRSSGKVRAILIGDVDFISDRFAVSSRELFGRTITVPANGNAALFLNSAEELAGSDYLLAIRGKAILRRPLERMMEIERNAHERWLKEERKLEQSVEELSRALASARSSGQAVTPGEVATALHDLETQRVKARSKLRELRRNARSESKHVENIVFFAATFLVPVFLLAVGIFVGQFRKKSR